MLITAMILLSVILVIMTSVLAVAVSPVFFIALLTALAITALLTVRSYQSPNNQQAPEPVRQGRVRE